MHCLHSRKAYEHYAGARERALPWGLWLAEGTSRAGQQHPHPHPHPLCQQPAWPGLQPGRESLSLSQKFSSKGFPAASLQHQCVVDSSGLLLGLFIFIFINMAKNRFFPWEMAVCIPSLADIYRTPLCAAFECLVVLTGFILTFTPPRQGIVCRHTGLKLRQPSPELKSGRSPLRCHLTLAVPQP